MKKPKWLSQDLIIALHKEQLIRHGGLHGIREEGLLQSCLDKPKNQFFYGSTDIVELAASYALGFCRNHVFVDGNKRIALLAMVTFLKQNHYTITAAKPNVYAIIMALAGSELSDKKFTSWLKDNTLKSQNKKPL